MAFVFDPMGTTVLITGASSGLGRGFAAEFARRGADLVLVARRRDKLQALADELSERYGTTSTVIAADLAAPGGVDEVVSGLEGRGIRWVKRVVFVLLGAVPVVVGLMIDAPVFWIASAAVTVLGLVLAIALPVVRDRFEEQEYYAPEPRFSVR